MPIFSNKFSPKKTPLRKVNLEIPKPTIEEPVSDDRVVHLNLSDQRLVFENGTWIPETGQNNAVYKSNQKMKKKLQELEEENNLLKLKYEVMLNMLTQRTAENRLQQREIDELKRKK